MFSEKRLYFSDFLLVPVLVVLGVVAGLVILFGGTE